MDTLQDIVEAGLDLRLWCFRCGHGTSLDSAKLLVQITQRCGSINLPDIVSKCRCKLCRCGDQSLLLPASRPGPKFEEAPPGQAMSRLVEAWFFSHHKKRR